MYLFFPCEAILVMARLFAVLLGVAQPVCSFTASVGWKSEWKGLIHNL